MTVCLQWAATASSGVDTRRDAALVCPGRAGAKLIADLVGLLVAPEAHQAFEVGIAILGQHDPEPDIKIAGAVKRAA